ncbi:MAG: transcription antitermination protein NusB [Bacteroidales bacterium]|nr:transcription antitermination protein NusB [Bacteroidales bacterium]
MLNRRILRIKAFKVLYSYAENPDLSLKEALGSLETSAEATRDLYLYMLSVIPALTGEAARRIEAAKGKFNPTEEDLSPNMKFVRNGISALLEGDPDFKRITEKKKMSWAQNDAFLSDLYVRLKTRDYFIEYMNSGTSSLKEDAALWKRVFEEEFEDDPSLAQILEDLSIHWADDLPYALGTCIRSLEEAGRLGRWSYPPLYMPDGEEFSKKLLSAAYGRYSEYSALIAQSVSKWDQDRLYTTDIVLIAMGLAEATTFPDIPIRVTINEYVEISKYYSTPKSRSFVNGLLDRLIKDGEAKGTIVKNNNAL